MISELHVFPILSKCHPLSYSLQSSWQEVCYIFCCFFLCNVLFSLLHLTPSSCLPDIFIFLYPCFHYYVPTISSNILGSVVYFPLFLQNFCPLFHHIRERGRVRKKKKDTFMWELKLYLLHPACSLQGLSYNLGLCIECHWLNMHPFSAWNEVQPTEQHSQGLIKFSCNWSLLFILLEGWLQRR